MIDIVVRCTMLYNIYSLLKKLMCFPYRFKELCAMRISTVDLLENFVPPEIPSSFSQPIRNRESFRKPIRNREFFGQKFRNRESFCRPIRN